MDSFSAGYKTLWHFMKIAVRIRKVLDADGRTKLMLKYLPGLIVIFTLNFEFSLAAPPLLSK